MKHQIHCYSNFKDAAIQMVNENSPCLYTLDRHQRITGVLTDRDIIAGSVIRQVHAEVGKVKKTVNKTVFGCSNDKDAQVLFKTMMVHKLDGIAVVQNDGQTLKEVRSVFDVMDKCIENMVFDEVKTTVKDLALDASYRQKLCRSDHSLISFIEQVFFDNVKAVGIVDAEDNFIGTISLRDILQRVVIPEFDPWTNNVESILERDNALYLTGSTSLMDAYNVMRRHRLCSVAVLDKNGKPYGIVHLTDVYERLLTDQANRMSFYSIVNALWNLLLLPWIMVQYLFNEKNHIPTETFQIKPSPDTDTKQSCTESSKSKSFTIQESCIDPEYKKKTARFMKEAETLYLDAASDESLRTLEEEREIFQPVICKLQEALMVLSEFENTAGANKLRASLMMKIGIIQLQIFEEPALALESFEKFNTFVAKYNEIVKKRHQCFFQNDSDQWIVYHFTAYIQLGRYEEAGKLARNHTFWVMSLRDDCISLLRTNTIEYAKEAKVQYQCGKFQDSILHYNIAIRINNILKNLDELPENESVIYSNRAACYLQIKDYYLAHGDAAAATKADPLYFKGWSRLISCLELTERFGECLQAIEDAKVHHQSQAEELDQIVDRINDRFLKYNTSPLPEPDNQDDQDTSMEDISIIDEKEEPVISPDFDSNAALAAALQKCGQIVQNDDNLDAAMEAAFAEFA